METFVGGTAAREGAVADSPFNRKLRYQMLKSERVTLEETTLVLGSAFCKRIFDTGADENYGQLVPVWVVLELHSGGGDGSDFSQVVRNAYEQAGARRVFQNNSLSYLGDDVHKIATDAGQPSASASAPTPDAAAWLLLKLDAGRSEICEFPEAHLKRTMSAAIDKSKPRVRFLIAQAGNVFKIHLRDLAENNLQEAKRKAPTSPLQDDLRAIGGDGEGPLKKKQAKLCGRVEDVVTAIGGQFVEPGSVTEVERVRRLISGIGVTM
eukprot:gene2263-2575_t